MAAFRKSKAILLKLFHQLKYGTTPFNVRSKHRFQHSATHCCHLQGTDSTLFLETPGATTAKVPCALCSTPSKVYQIFSSNSSNVLSVGK